MKILQRLAALFGAQYACIVWSDTAHIVRVQEICPGIWIQAYGGRRLAPGGSVQGSSSEWIPLTAKVKRFHAVNADSKNQ